MKNITICIRALVFVIPLLMTNSLMAHTGVVLADSVSLSGRITFVTGQPMQDVELTITDGVMSVTVLTDVDGKYMFTGLPAGVDYSVEIHKDDDPRRGVTVSDLVLLRNHILAINNNILPFNVLAMDANLSGSVSTFDIVVIMKNILAIQDINPSWRFVSSYMNFPNPQNPWTVSFPDAFFINSSSTKVNVENLDFTAYKFSDINQNVHFND